ncbi:MAG: hypothetical protein HXY19_07015 [Thermoanaerobaculaceae bacterium]|nr:hypothetical protein [Thermoanaerobaculaceae bacterium]
MENERSFPTMIIPRGTEITVNEQGLLSIRTPGNLVIQNPGNYSMIECGNGSVRIDPNIKVEAVTIQAADTCLIAGTLTAWRVKAKKIILEKGAQAFIMLQESDALELDRSARLVGNFASEDELYLMLGRFRRQLRELPAAVSGGVQRSELPGGEEVFLPPAAEEAVNEEAAEAAAQELEALFQDSTASDAAERDAETQALVLLLLERERRRLTLLGQLPEALNRLITLVREKNHALLASSFRQLFAAMGPLSEDLEQAQRMLERQFPTA